MGADAAILILLLPAFVVGAIISILHVPLGQEVLKRGIIFLDLAVAQFAALGMIFFKEFIAREEYYYMSLYGEIATGLALAFMCALFFQYLEKRSGRYQEPLIGCAFVLAASLALLIVSSSPTGGESVKDILEGQILWVSWKDALMIGPLFLIMFFIWTFFRAHRSRLFYPLFALAIPFSVNLIGIYLVFASLIFPALGVVSIQTNKLIWGYVISLFAFISGLAMSYLFDLSAGPAIVLCFAICSTIPYLHKSNKSAFKCSD